MPLSNLLYATPSFAGHQTFAVRSGWLKKGIDALQSPATGAGETFAREDALVTLGVGKNMVQSIKHWLTTTRFAEEYTNANTRKLRPTNLGRLLFGSPDELGWDPFFEDPGTLWLLHWRICGPGSPAFAWVWVFNIFHEFEFTKDSLTDVLEAAIQGTVTKPASRETIERDVQCILNTYVQQKSTKLSDDDLDCPVRSLGLVRNAGERRFQFQVGSKHSLPVAIFTYALLDFWKWREAGETLDAWDITYAEGSPGTVFKLDEDSVLAYLDRLGEITQGAFVFEDNPLGRVALRTRNVAANETVILEDYYNAER